MRRVVFLISALCCLSIPLVAKSPIKGIPKEVKVIKPLFCDYKNTADYLLSCISLNYGQDNSSRLSRPWDVYSDRAHNITYVNNSNTSKPFSELGFKEKVRIARIKKDFALVYKVTEENESIYPSIPKDVEWMGWVPMSNLVFYDHPLVNEACTYRRVLFRDNVVYSPRLMLTAKLFDSPEDGASSRMLPDKTDTFFYLVKSAGRRILISCGTDLTVADSIYGWVDKDDFILWNSIIGLEPTWTVSDISFLGSNNAVCFLKDKNDNDEGAINFVFNGTSQSYNPDNYRMSSNQVRFPLVYNNGTSSRIAIPGDSEFLNVASPRVPIIVSENADSERTDFSSRINILFIIDGSRIYEPFFPILADRISALESLNMGTTEVRVGIIIYHDARNEKNKMEFHQFTSPSDEKLYEFIDLGGTYGFKDNLSQAPLMLTLSSATSLLNDSYADNYAVIIGGRGDDADSNIIVSDLANDFSKNNVSLFAIQVQNIRSEPTYRLFGYAMNDLIEQTAALKSSSDLFTSKVHDNNIEKVSFIKAADNSELPDYIYMTESGLLSETDFSTCLEAVMQRIIQSASSAGGTSLFPHFFREVIAMNDFEGRPFFKKVAMYSTNELDSLIELFEQLCNLNFKDDEKSRDDFISIIVDNIPSSVKPRVIGPKFADTAYSFNSKDDIMRVGYKRLLSSIEGLSGLVDRYEGPSIKEIQSKKSVSTEQFRQILSEIFNKYNRLLEIRNTPSIYATPLNGEQYYWVPLEDLI